MDIWRPAAGIKGTRKGARDRFPRPTAPRIIPRNVALLGRKRGEAKDLRSGYEHL